MIIVIVAIGCAKFVESASRDRPNFFERSFRSRCVNKTGSPADTFSHCLEDYSDAGHPLRNRTQDLIDSESATKLRLIQRSQLLTPLQPVQPRTKPRAALHSPVLWRTIPREAHSQADTGSVSADSRSVCVKSSPTKSSGSPRRFANAHTAQSPRFRRAG